MKVLFNVLFIAHMFASAHASALIIYSQAGGTWLVSDDSAAPRPADALLPEASDLQALDPDEEAPTHDEEDAE